MGWDVYAFGARYYDPVIARWSVPDPLAEEHYNYTPYHYTFNNPILFIDPVGLDTFNINIANQSIDRIAVENSKTHVFIIAGEDSETNYTLNINDDGLVKFPDAGYGFGRYSKEDKGGDHFLKPETAAALFGLTTEMKDNNEDFRIDFGDMSNSEGGAPGGDHYTHGGKGGLSGLCIDYRYLGHDSRSYQGQATDSKFSVFRNWQFTVKAGQWGFNKNYLSNQGVWNLGPIKFQPNGKLIDDHNDHGHLTYTR